MKTTAVELLNNQLNPYKLYVLQPEQIEQAILNKISIRTKVKKEKGNLTIEVTHHNGTFELMRELRYTDIEYSIHRKGKKYLFTIFLYEI